MQSNLLDPASNLWSTTSPTNTNMFAQQTPSSDTSSAHPNSKDSNFGMNNNFFAQPGNMTAESGQQDNKQQGNPGNNGNNMNGDGGDTFMGVQTPGPNGVGLGGWKWTVMSGDKP